MGYPGSIRRAINQGVSLTISNFKLENMITNWQTVVFYAMEVMGLQFGLFWGLAATLIGLRVKVGLDGKAMVLLALLAFGKFWF